MLSGGLGAGATVAAPVFTSSFKHALGLWADCENNVAMLFAAPNGTNQSGSYAVSWGQSGGSPLVGFLGATPVARQSVPAAATDPATTQALVNAIRSALVTNGLLQ